MSRILIVTEESEEIKKLAQGLSRAGFPFSFVRPDADTIAEISKVSPSLVMVEISEALSYHRAGDLCREVKREMSLPVMALIPKWALSNLVPSFPIDDFVVIPCDEREFTLRIGWLLQTTGNPNFGEVVKGGELVIDTARAEVTLNGNRIDLTYREYELLRFLIANKGHVFSREALLNKVWGYDYYGGDRTVDVHIRRLRSKIEVGDRNYIETVRNIGYRFRDDD